MTSTIIAEYKDSLNTIKQAGFINSEDMSFLSDNISEIQSNWTKQQIFRTETEMRVSVLDPLHYPTRASQYWQCVREQGVMYQELVRGSFQYRKLLIKIKKTESKLGNTSDCMDRELLQIKLEEQLFDKLNLDQQLKDRIREVKMWHCKMEELSKDGDFNTNDVNEHQLVSYALRFQNQVELMRENPGGSSQGEIDNLVGQFKGVQLELEEKGLFSPQHPDFVANQKLSEPERLAIRNESMHARVQAIAELEYPKLESIK